MSESPDPTGEPALEIGFKAAWDVWRTDTRFEALEPELRAAIRCGFIAGWKARGALET